ncbi:TniQ family protein [Brevibacillus porteri]|uniref:TniQ family protein n=1 Tax=Brevibacillus porteri TaxID=2126350 RepID=UPI00370B175D
MQSSRSRVVMPPRSRLYNISPIGIGTNQVESLTSYIARLSEAHCVFVTDLVRYEIFNAIEDLPKSYHRDFFRKAEQINGQNSLAKRTVTALESLTLRTDLVDLTMSRLKGIIPTNQLLRQSKAWCKYCYQYWRDSGDILYDPLLWSFKIVNYCHVHGCRLSSNCEKCGSCLTYLNKCTRPGYCSYCNSWLGEIEQKINIDAEKQLFEVWVSTNVGDLIRYLWLDKNLTRNKLRESLIYYVDVVSSGKPYVFAGMAGINPDTFWHSYKGISILSLGDLMRICYFLRIGICDFINQIAIKQSWDNNRRTNQRASILKVLDYEIVKRQLEKALSNENPKSLREIGRNIEIHPNRLMYNFPELCKAISERYKVFRRETSKKKGEELRKQVQDTIVYLQSLDIYPSQRAIKNVLHLQKIFIKPEIKQIWQDILSKQELNKE